MATGKGSVKQPESDWKDYSAPAGDEGWQDAPVSAAALATEPSRVLDEGEIPLTSHAAATESGLRSIGRGIKGAVSGAAQMLDPRAQEGEGKLAPPFYPLVRAARGLYGSMRGATQIPAAIHDINQSADPVGYYARAAQETAGQGAGQLGTMAATEGMGKLPLGRVLRTGAEGVENFDVTRPFKSFGKIGDYWRDASPENKMLAETRRAVRERRASMIPLRVRSGGVEGGSMSSDNTPSSPSPTFVPEPRPNFAGETEGYMGSVPREELNDLALRRKPGAGKQLQQLGKPIIYIPSGSDLP